MWVGLEVIERVSLVEPQCVLEVPHAYHGRSGMVGTLLILRGDAWPIHVTRVIMTELHAGTVAECAAALAEHGILARVVACEYVHERGAVLHVAQIDSAHVCDRCVEV